MLRRRAARPTPGWAPAAPTPTLTLTLTPTPTPNQADSKLSQKLGADDFKEFLSQHEMTLVNFFAPHRSTGHTCLRGPLG